MVLTGSDKGHSRSLAILQTGLLKTWLWASTVEMVAEPGVAAGIACSYFGVLQSGSATRHDSIDSRSAELDAGDFAAQSAAFKTAMGQAGARVASLLLVPPLTALGSSWLPFAMQAPGRPENLVRAFFLLDKVMREVLLDATPVRLGALDEGRRGLVGTVQSAYCIHASRLLHWHCLHYCMRLLRHA